MWRVVSEAEISSKWISVGKLRSQVPFIGNSEGGNHSTLIPHNQPETSEIRLFTDYHSTEMSTDKKQQIYKLGSLQTPHHPEINFIWFPSDRRRYWSSSEVLQRYSTMGRLERNAKHTDKLKTYECPILTKQKIEEKTRLRRDWHRLWSSESKRLLNTATQELKQLLSNNKNDCIQTFLQGLTPTESTVEGDQEN
jgi:hypothetical protein